MVRAKAKASAITHGLVQEPEFEAGRCRLLTTDEAKATIAAKGWTNRALADWWGCRAEYISKIIHDPARKRHFDDALRGLPSAATVQAEKRRG
jgi:hypothetical protein